MELLLIGFAAGLVHVFTGPDHLAALAPFASRNKTTSPWQLGLTWGIGHATGATFIGLTLWLLKDSAYIENLSSGAEYIVGLLLILIGTLGLYNGLKEKIHSHEHSHYGIRHSHIHSHISLSETANINHKHSHAALGIGLLHGTAGGTHLWAILPTLAIAKFDGLALYLGAYALSTIASMIFFTAAIGRLTKSLTNRNPQWGPRFNLCCCSGTILIGCCWLIYI